MQEHEFLSQQHILLYKVQYYIFDYVEYIYVTMLESVVELGAMATRGMDFWYLKYEYSVFLYNNLQDKRNTYFFMRKFFVFLLYIYKKKLAPTVVFKTRCRSLLY
jgi:hypothetical protein